MEVLKSNSIGLQGQIPWGFPVPLLDLQAWTHDERLRTFTTVREFLWYYISPDCSLLTWWVWDLILSCLCTSYDLAKAYSLSLDTGYVFFDRFKCPPVDCISTASCNFGILTGGDDINFLIAYDYFCFIDYVKVFVWITINCGKFSKIWVYQTTWPASWETCMQVRKQQLELDIEQQTGSK